MRFLRDEDGQMLVMTALLVAVLLGFVGIATDIGLLFRDQRNMQIAADAAAVAATLDYKYNQQSSSAIAAGQLAAAQNGVTNGTNGTATISCPPADGPNAGSVGFCEAVVSQPNRTFFMSLFGHNVMSVAARAVAGIGGADNCVYLLGTTGVDFDSSGGASANLNCGMIDDSSSNNAFSASGGVSVNAASIGIVGGTSITGGAMINPQPTTGINSSGNPLPRSTPSTSGCGAALNYAGGTTATASPGCYNGLSISGGARLTLQPGLYVFNGPINVSGGGALTGTDVTLYFNNTINFSGGTTFNLSAPTSGYWNGILFYESPADTNTLQMSGGSSSVLQGIIYLPNSILNMSGGSGMTLNAAFVVKQLQISGGISFKLNDYTNVNHASPLASVTLVE